MKVTALRTHKVTDKDKNIFKILDHYIKNLKEESVVAVTSKIVSITEGRIIKIKAGVSKDDLVKKEAEYYLPRAFNQYGFMISINRGVMVASAGIDESNGNGYYVLWPKDPQKSANKIRSYLSKKFDLQKIGVIITDSKLTPLRWGVTGVAIAHSGFRAINSYIGKPDIFGRNLRAEKVNVADALATSAVMEMGEGNEQQPLAVITEIQSITFQPRNPTPTEIKNMKISLKNDVFASLIAGVDWKKGQ